MFFKNLHIRSNHGSNTQNTLWITKSVVLTGIPLGVKENAICVSTEGTKWYFAKKKILEFSSRVKTIVEQIYLKN